LREDGEADNEGHVARQKEGVTRGRAGNGLEVLVVAGKNDISERIERTPAAIASQAERGSRDTRGIIGNAPAMFSIPPSQNVL